MHRQATDKGIFLIQAFEGFSAFPYRDVAGLWTVGIGHLIKSSETFTMPITQQEGEALLRKDLWTAERAVLRLIRVPLNDSQFDALVSFTFNLGSGSLQRSALRAKINRGEYEAAGDEFLKWIWAGKKKSKGLLRRRIAERGMFLRNF